MTTGRDAQVYLSWIRSAFGFACGQDGLPQELRLAQVTTVEGANQFLRDHYIARFNGQFTVAAQEKCTAFRRTSRTDLNWVFTVQTERVVAKDNTVAIADRSWQIAKTRFRHTLAGSTVTIHEHLDETVSIRFGVNNSQALFSRPPLNSL